MHSIVTLIGGFGALMGLFGAFMGLFTGGVGISASADGAGSVAGQGFGAVVAAIIGMTGAFVARGRIRTGGALLLASAAMGMLLALWVYAVGAILLTAAGVLAFWASPQGGENE